jgi:hypothetical protein
MISVIWDTLIWVFVEGISFLLDKLKSCVKPPLLGVLARWNRKQVEAARK